MTVGELADVLTGGVPVTLSNTHEGIYWYGTAREMKQCEWADFEIDHCFPTSDATTEEDAWETKFVDHISMWVVTKL